MMMLKRALVSLVLCGAALTTFAVGFEAKGDSFPAEFTMTSWSSSATTSSLTAEGVVGEGYGKVYLSYEFFSTTADRLKGNFTGSLRSINQDGDLVAASLQGIWKREGTMVTMHTLDAFSNGDMIYAKGAVDLFNGTLVFEAFPIE